MGTSWREIHSQIILHWKLIFLMLAGAISLEYLLLGWQESFGQLALCTVALVPEAVLDGIYMRLYHRLSLVLAAVGILARTALPITAGGDVAAAHVDACEALMMAAVADMAAGAMVLGGLLLILFLTTGKIGFGDVCYGGALGIMLGLDRAWVAFFLTFWLGLAWAAGLCITRLVGTGKIRQAVPLGPFMAAGSLISMIYGKELMAWYLQGF